MHVWGYFYHHYNHSGALYSCWEGGVRKAQKDEKRIRSEFNTPSPRFVRNNKVGNDRKDSVASVLSATNNVLQESKSQLDIRKKSSVNGVLNEDSSILDTRKESAMNGQALHLPRSTNGAYRQYRMNFYIMFLTIFVCNTISFVPSMIYLFLHEHDLYFFFRHDDAVLNIHLTMQRLYVTNHVLNLSYTGTLTSRSGSM